MHTDAERDPDHYLAHGKKCSYLHKKQLFRTTEKNPEISALGFRHLREWHIKRNMNRNFKRTALINWVRDIF